jgi:hypothetical protein
MSDIMIVCMSDINSTCHKLCVVLSKQMLRHAGGTGCEYSVFLIYTYVQCHGDCAEGVKCCHNSYSSTCCYVGAFSCAWLLNG